MYARLSRKKRTTSENIPRLTRRPTQTDSSINSSHSTQPAFNSRTLSTASPARAVCGDNIKDLVQACTACRSRRGLSSRQASSDDWGTSWACLGPLQQNRPFREILAWRDYEDIRQTKPGHASLELDKTLLTHSEWSIIKSSKTLHRTSRNDEEMLVRTPG